MALISRKKVFGAKIETTPGTAEAMTGSEASFNAWDYIIQNETVMDEVIGQGGFGRNASVPGAYVGKVSFKTHMGWDGTSTEPSWADTLLPMCGYVKSSQVFTPRTEYPGSNVKTGTLAVWKDGKYRVLKGCMGTFKIIGPSGKLGVIEWEFSGVWVPETDVSIVTPTYPTAKALRHANSTSTWNSIALCYSNITYDAGNVLSPIECPSGEGIAMYIVSDRNSKVTADPEAKTVATQDRMDQMLSMFEGALTYDFDGPTNSKITIAAPKAQIIKNTEAERSGVVIDQLEWQLNKNASAVDQESSITFTAAS
jgi:hypothetical protein